MIYLVSEIKKGMATKKVHNKAKQISCNHEHKSIEQVEQDLQMKLQATAQRLRRYIKGMKVSTKLYFSRIMEF